MPYFFVPLSFASHPALSSIPPFHHNHLHVLHTTTTKSTIRSKSRSNCYIILYFIYNCLWVLCYAGVKKNFFTIFWLKFLWWREQNGEPLNVEIGLRVLSFSWACSKGELIEKCPKDCEKSKFWTCRRIPLQIRLEKLFRWQLGVFWKLKEARGKDFVWILSFTYTNSVTMRGRVQKSIFMRKALD